MNNYNFLMTYLHERVCYANSPNYDSDGNFSVIVVDGEGNCETTIWFNKDGEVIDK